ncbi:MULTISPECIES: hemolysin family protein [unclassified Hyphomicrobium]|uniref:hemolysin family protein n=1 Tax=unclassified Hyphomicrobium TaxID=2619925 RepID=UPI000213F292|nr:MULTISPECIES: hemolysin family protein [unclassified Hyphomicrobium]CCB67980.1 Putative HlyC/CorC family of transporters with CBS domains [Hyphomicrobium sp. MC1]
MTMTDNTQDKPLSDSLADEARAFGSLGWLHLLRSKLGLVVPQNVRDALEGALKTGGTDNFTEAERKMLERLLQFGSSRVASLMVPRADITALDENEPISELLQTFNEAGVSRIPLFRETLDDPRGMIHIKDVLRWLMAEATGQSSKNGKVDPDAPVPMNLFDLRAIDLNKPITTVKIRRQILYVPPSMPAVDLLIRMQSTRIHMALVVDEYGGTDGLVTIEDLVEQVVGNIEDEHDDDDETNIVVDPKLGIVAVARTPIEELEKHLGVKLVPDDEETDVDTIGGLIFSMLGRVPARGELIRHPTGVEFEVLDADPRRVKKLKIHPPRPPLTNTKSLPEAPKA